LQAERRQPETAVAGRAHWQATSLGAQEAEEMAARRHGVWKIGC
jgi:hypothetical protein